MKKRVFLLSLVLGIPAFGLAATAEMAPIPPAQIEEEQFNPWQVRVRGIAVLPGESGSTKSSTISVIGGKVTDISNEYVPELDFNYFFTPRISAELILATTRHSVDATETVLGKVDLGKVNLLPPTLSLLYHMFPDRTISPYIGGGVNYTHFYNVNTGPVASAIDYDNSWGGVIQGGIDLHLDSHWSLNVDVKKVFLKTDVTVTALDSKMETEVKINPLIVGFGIGYRF